MGKAQVMRSSQREEAMTNQRVINAEETEVGPREFKKRDQVF
jgi:hypothetical protein